MAGVPVGHIRVARVLSQDDKWITLEVAKSNDTPFTLDQENPDHFFTLIFIHNTAEDGEPPSMETWLPWEADDAES